MKISNFRLALVAVVLSLAGSCRASAAQSEGFSDVPKTHWAYEAVTYLKQKGILVGYPPEQTPGKKQAGAPVASHQVPAERAKTARRHSPR